MHCEPRECKSVRSVNRREGQTVGERSMGEREGCMMEVSVSVCVRERERAREQEREKCICVMRGCVM